jgi:hypothetical protein
LLSFLSWWLSWIFEAILDWISGLMRGILICSSSLLEIAERIAPLLHFFSSSCIKEDLKSRSKVSGLSLLDLITKNPVEQRALSNSASITAHEDNEPSMDEIITSLVATRLLALVGRFFPSSSW